MAVSSLTVGTGSGSGVDTLALLNAGTTSPLQVINDFALQPGGALTLSNSAFQALSSDDIHVDGPVVCNNSILTLSNSVYGPHTWLGQSQTASLCVTNSQFGAGYLVLGDAFDATATFVNSTSLIGSKLSLARQPSRNGIVTVIGGQFIATNTTPLTDPHIIGNAGYGQLIASNANVQLYDTIIGNRGPGSVALQGGAMRMGKTYLGYGDPRSIGAMTLSGGQITIPELQVGVQGTGTVNIAGATLQVSGTVYLGNQSFNSSHGSLSIIGGSCTVPDALHVGNPSSAPCSATLTAGLLAVANASQTGLLHVANGVLTQNGGSLIADYLVATNTTGLIAFNGGQMTLSGSSVSNGIPLTVGNGAGSATLNLPSGTHSFANGLDISPGAILSVGCARIDGPVVNMGTIQDNCPGGLAVFTGPFTNNSTIVAGAGQTIEFWGPVVNNGLFAGSDGGAFHFYGSLANNGAISNTLSPPSLTWQSWSEVPGKMTTDVPVKSARFLNSLYLFAKRDTDSLIFYAVYDGAHWGTWTLVPGGGATLADLAILECNLLHLIHTSTNGISEQIFDRVNWTGPNGVPGSGIGGITANALNYGGYLYLFLKGGMDPSLYFTRFNGTGWFDSWLRVPGTVTTDAPLGSVNYQKVLCLFAKGFGDNGIYLNKFDNAAWAGWEEVPGGLTTDRSLAATVHEGHLYLFGKGYNGQAIYVNALTGTNWSGWSAVPGNGLTDVALAASDFRSKLNLFRVDPNHHIYVTSAVDRRHLTVCACPYIPPLQAQLSVSLPGANFKIGYLGELFPDPIRAYYGYYAQWTLGWQISPSMKVSNYDY